MDWHPTIYHLHRRFINDARNTLRPHTRASGSVVSHITGSYRTIIITLIVALLPIARLSAQDIAVTEFYLAENDLTANGRNAVEDQNGDKCALIRVQTTQKGFLFDVGSAGITKVEDSHVCEIWLWVPYGIKHVSIRHPQLGSLPNYDFPIAIQKARTYIMKITHEQVFVTNYDDTKKQTLSIKITPPGATLSLNGMSIGLDSRGEATQRISHGRFTYRVEADGYYPEEGQVVVDDRNRSLIVENLKPIMGKLSVHVNPSSAALSVDARNIGQSTSEPVELQIGKHEVTVSAQGYKTETRSVEITENQTTEISVALSRIAHYTFTSIPDGAHVYVDRQYIGTTPCTKEYTTGTYTIKASKAGYRDFESILSLNSSDPTVRISLHKIYNYRNMLYAEGNVRTGTFIALGATLGGYAHRFNLEVSYLYGLGESEPIYWNSSNSLPAVAHYTPEINSMLKIGYGIPIATRFLITPQVGLSHIRLSETMDEASAIAPADGAYAICSLFSLRLSAAIINHLAVSLTPEYSFSAYQSDRYTALAKVSPKIGNWSDGFFLKLGVSLFF